MILFNLLLRHLGYCHLKLLLAISAITCHLSYYLPSRLLLCHLGYCLHHLRRNRRIEIHSLES